MHVDFIFALVLGLLITWIVGYPIAVRLGLDHGLRGLGFASALGTSAVLIACRSLQMVWPMQHIAVPLAVGVTLMAVVQWTPSVGRRALDLCREYGARLGILVAVAGAVVVALNAPILFGNAIHFDGSRIHDSFTFITSARYMLSHTFHGAPDFDPSHPIFTISRGYFGDAPMQPRPAAEGFLAWLSALRSSDPMVLYNGLQSAGVVLAGMSVFAFLAPERTPTSRTQFVILALLAFAMPNLLHLANNSNFANALNLPAATAYVALGTLPRTSRSFIAAMLLIGCLLSGYPEMLVFIGACRFFGVVIGARKDVSAAVKECAWLLLEVICAALLLPWAAKGTATVYLTTLGVSKAGASELGGNMYAGLPLAISATLALALAWRAIGKTGQERRERSLLLAIVVAFGLAQLVMLRRSFDYGGFKLSEYFVTLLSGSLILSVAALLRATPRVAGVTRRPRQSSVAFVAALLVLLGLRDAQTLARGWEFAASQRITPDFVAMSQRMATAANGQLVALGKSPSPFYYAMWAPYLSDQHVVYDFANDPYAAGYLSSYLKANETARYEDATYRLEIDEPGPPREAVATDAISMGPFHLLKLAEVAE